MPGTSPDHHGLISEPSWCVQTVKVAWGPSSTWLGGVAFGSVCGGTAHTSISQEKRLESALVWGQTSESEKARTPRRQSPRSWTRRPHSTAVCAAKFGTWRDCGSKQEQTPIPDAICQRAATKKGDGSYVFSTKQNSDTHACTHPDRKTLVECFRGPAFNIWWFL